MRINSPHKIVILLLILNSFPTSCGQKAGKKNEENRKHASEFSEIRNPVLPGDFADPSIIRVGEEYWATATSSQWAPLFPLLRSRNMNNWEIVDHVFPDGVPDWASSHFWAPELTFDNGKYFVYYTAKKNNGPLCVGVATAENPEGPYEDLGPIVCQEAGAIDGAQIRDADGKLYLIWKEDGNSRNEPTPIWGQEMNEERTKLLGKKFELFRNDPDTWEGNLVEGAYLVKKNGYYYAFYSGDACCGRGCTYGIGVARAKNIRGPWEKYEQNPIRKENDQWKCMGHGSLVKDPTGRYFFLYHGYSKKGSVYTGRQGLLSEVVWNENGWPELVNARRAVKQEEKGDANHVVNKENFGSDKLSNYWQWPVNRKPEYAIHDGSLLLQSKPEGIGSILGKRTLSPDYEATAVLSLQGNLPDRMGIAGIGDSNNAVGLAVQGNEVLIWKVKGNKEDILSREKLEGLNEIHLRMKVSKGENYSFFWSRNGDKWNDFEGENRLNGAYLPPWDRAVRVGLTSNGPAETEAKVNSFEIRYY